jgi:hypothetical protein
MSKIVFKDESTLNLHPDDNPYLIAIDKMHAIQKEHPEYKHLIWSVSVTEYMDNRTVFIIIKVSDPKKPSHKENIRLAVYLAVIMLALFFLSVA